MGNVVVLSQFGLKLSVRKTLSLQHEERLSAGPCLSARNNFIIEANC